MRKIIKKTLAGLIAGVMAVSSMPFVALADDATALDEAKTALSSFSYSGITTKTGTWYNNNSGTETMPTETYSNLLYAADSNADKGEFTNDSKSTKGYLRYQTVVFLYDNITTPRAPIMVVYGATSNLNRFIGAITLSDNQNNALQLIGNWNCSRKGNYGNGWEYANVWAQNGGDDINPGIDVNNPTKEQIAGQAAFNNWNVQPGMANKMEYKGSFADGTYTQIITPTIDFYQGGTSPYTDVHDTITGTEKLYAVNYKAVLATIDQAKTDITSVSYDTYTEASVNTYAAAVKALTEFNVSSLTFSADTLATDVETAGTTIKGLVDAYTSAKNGLEVKTYTYTFVNAEGTTVGTVEATSVEEALASSEKPANTATKYEYVDNTKHNVTTYAWQDASAVTGTTISEVASTASEAHTIDANTHLCTLCDGAALDTSNYDTQLAIVKGIAENKDEKYTTDSITALKQIIDTVEAERENVTTQEELDALTKILMESTCDLAIAKNTVTFYTVAAGSTSPTEVDTQTLAYGTTYTANANANVKQWIVTTDKSNTSTKLNTFDSNVDVIVTKDVSIYAYLSDEDTSEASSKVTFLGKNNQVVAIRYVASGEVFYTSTVDVPEIPFYKGSVWDTDLITGDGNEYTVKATYTYLLGATTCLVNLVGEDGTVTWTKGYSYDSYVYLSTADKSQKYALYSDEACSKLLTYIDGVDFYAPKTEKVYVKAYTGESEPTVAVTGSFSTSTSTKNYANFNCKFYLPADASAVEWGLEVKVGDGQYAKVKAESKSERNEYTVKIGTKVDGGVTSIEGRAYLVYNYNGVTYTINSGDLTTVTFS